jgi:transcription termination/antitermination protein NusA
VVEWSDDPSRFVAKALAPASVKEVRIEQDTQTALVIVPDYQLSLAIGKEGQNARLAARLTGWRIDIKSESQFAEEQAAARSQTASASPSTTAAAASVSPAATRGVASGDTSASTGVTEASPKGAPLATAGEADGASADAVRQCRAVLASGERCTNAARPGSDYCGIAAHQKQGQEAPQPEGTQA